MIEAIAASVIAGVIVAAVLAAVKWRPRRRAVAPRSATPASAPAPEVADLATGIGQAIMAVRDAIDLFERRGVLLEPDTFALEETGAEALDEARRTVAEAEARLPRVQLHLGERAGGATRAVDDLRRAVGHLRSYVSQDGVGDEWSEDELHAARSALDEATERQERFLAEAAA